MLIGRYYHTIETTGRISIPVRFREQLGNNPVITRGLDGSLFLFSQQEWLNFSSQLQSSSMLKKVNRDLARLMANEAAELEYDKSGRVIIPEYLRTYASLSENVVFAGSVNKVEVWNRDTYHAYLEKIEKNAETIAEEFEPAVEVINA